MRARILLVAALAALLLSCDAIRDTFEPQWEPAETNGNDGVFHFVMNAFDLHIGYPEHVRVERIESRTTKKPNGATQVQKRERKVRVIMARCESKSICDAIPHSEDTREIVVTPKIFGTTTLYVTAVVDEKEEFKDSIKVRVQ
ncbi:MAG: hypothetical protein ACLQVI_43865 [Polyangiaceae bacterium]|jgi:hypothetical protein